MSATLHLLIAVAVVASTRQQPAGGAPSHGAPPVDFAREVLPLLADRCFACHGPDEVAREAGLRLDRRDDAFAPLDSGERAIVPGDAAASVLVARVMDPRHRRVMPPPSSGKALSEAERALLARWIDEGARWADHWSWTAPVAEDPPPVRDAAWCREPLDRFVLARLEREGLTPSPEADPVTLLRRATLALTGLPPTPAEVDAFVDDVARERATGATTPSRPDAYDRVIERLLASPHYGERMALPWLDAGRYADSNGFQQDGDNQQWVWRDWLVRALNDDVPLDRLTTLMLAGDLLPAASPEERMQQQVATGLQRLHLLNGEGGNIAEEQRNVIVFDRVDAFATTFLGQTAACAQCHDHKFDPWTQREYYALFDFFNRVPESGRPDIGGAYRLANPFVSVATPQHDAAVAAATRAAAEADARVASMLVDPMLAVAEASWAAEAGRRVARVTVGGWEAAAPIAAADFDAACEVALERASDWSARTDLVDGVALALAGDSTAFFFRRTLRATAPVDLTLHFGSDDALRVWLAGDVILERKVSRAVAPDQERAAVSLGRGEHALVVQVTNGGGPGGFWFEARAHGLPLQRAALVAGPRTARSHEDAALLRARFLEADPPPRLASALAEQRAARAALAEARAGLPRVMVMSDAMPRETHVLARGDYRSPLAAVAADTPAFLPPLPPDAPRDRLGLARWLVAPGHPLFARVMVNRAWQVFFGTGLVKTAEDFGVQGEPPSHPALLDALALGLADSGWSTKELHRAIVASATFRQSSRLAGERGRTLLERDPENRLLARGPRQRLPAMLLRDVALAASGLLARDVGGAPVYPYQPADIWDGLAITKEREFVYPEASGADLYRRSLYTFWRRTVAPGNMFNASTRQACQVRTTVTSTPLHALTMLNDPTWVEAGRALAEAALRAHAELDGQLTFAFRRVLARAPVADELALLRGAVRRARAAFAEDQGGAARFLSIGASARDEGLDLVQHAALAVTCLTLFNLDEAMTCE